MKKFRPKSINPRMNRLFSSGRYRLYKIEDSNLYILFQHQGIFQVNRIP